MYKPKALTAGFLAAAVLTAVGPLAASGYLFFLEAQGVAGYAGPGRGVVFYSHHAEEVMQKPSLGFDYVRRFSDASGDRAVLAVQFRLSADLEDGVGLKPQLYNGYLRLKLGPADLWAGHNRPRFGLAADLDGHALLLQPLTMNGFGFDRDWGAGLERDYSRGKAGLSLTTGSGMPLLVGKNYFLAARMTWGVPERDNVSLGLSAGGGRIWDVMGYHRMSEAPLPFYALEADVTLLMNNLESRLEAVVGRKDGQLAAALMWRAGLSLLPEGQLKVEVQPVALLRGDEAGFQVSGGVTFLAGADWTLRGMVRYDRGTRERAVVLQVYYYKGLRF